MVEFRTAYYGPMDREYHQSITETPQPIAAEESIFPISQLGETVPEHDPSGRFKNIIQTTQAAIRGGAGTLQLVMMTPPESAIGGRPKAYGKEVRETLKEVALASGVNIAGIEMPTSLNNLSGFDYQQLVFSDEKRKMHLDEVKDAIKFAADVGRGGGVDLVSWEFPRSVNEATWQPHDEKKQKFMQEGEQKIGWLVDQRTGRTIQFRKDEKQHVPWNKDFTQRKPTAEQLEKGDLPLESFEWKDFKEWANYADGKLRKGMNPFTGIPLDDKEKADVKQRTDEGKPAITPEEVYIQVQLQGQINSLLGWRTTYSGHAHEAMREKQILQEALQQGYMEGPGGQRRELDTPEKRQKVEEDIKRLDSRYKDYVNTAHGQQQQVDELKERVRNLKPMEDYALSRSTRTYAEAGIAAMRTTQEGMQRQNPTVNRDIYVGPEIGWPGYYGSHPDEFIKLVQESRKEMVKLLTNAMIEIPDPVHGKKPIQNPYRDPNITPQKAQELADRHIKGLFDTSHMGMWLAHFKPLTDEKTGRIIETEEQRIERFKKDFYLPAVKKIAEAGIVGGLQLVDSQSAAHGHLPPGEGIFPVMETAKIFKEKGFSGFVVSEGHEEEKFGEGRIRMKTWQHAGAAVGGGYFSGPPLRWGQVQQSYFGRTYSPMFMFGGYAPSNEFKLWSEVPLE